jgi:hypothetical protein
MSLGLGQGCQRPREARTLEKAWQETHLYQQLACATELWTWNHKDLGGRDQENRGGPGFSSPK